MRELVDCAIDERGVPVLDGARDGPRDGARGGGGRRVTVNLAESPLGWLRSRRLIDARQFAAGERLRADYETASIAPSVTMR